MAYLAVPLKQEFSEDLTVTDPKQREILYGQFNHVRYYSLEIFCKRLTEAGFNTEKISWPESYQGALKDSMLSDPFILARKI